MHYVSHVLSTFQQRVHDDVHVASVAVMHGLSIVTLVFLEYFCSGTHAAEEGCHKDGERGDAAAMSQLLGHCCARAASCT
jgi:hypothetical protein